MIGYMSRARYVGALFCVPHDLRKRLTKCWNFGVHPVERFIGNVVRALIWSWSVLLFFFVKQHKWIDASMRAMCVHGCPCLKWILFEVGSFHRISWRDGPKEEVRCRKLQQWIVGVARGNVLTHGCISDGIVCRVKLRGFAHSWCCWASVKRHSHFFVGFTIRMVLLFFHDITTHIVAIDNDDCFLF